MLTNLWRSIAREIVAAARGEDRSSLRSPSTSIPSEMPSDGLTSEAVFHDAALK